MSTPIEAPATVDEFAFLASDAERVGATGPLPTVRRVWATAPDHRSVSGLSFAGEHPPEIVTLHGAGLNAHSFDPTLLALGRPALSLDLPGHGRSDWREDADYRPQRLTAAIAAALDQLTVGPVTLLGHSLGGLTAALVAELRPERVRDVILIDITPGVSPARDAGAVREFIQGKRDFATVDEIVARAQQFGIGRDPEALMRGVTLNTRRRADGRLEWTHHLAHMDGLTIGGASGDGDDAALHPYEPIWESLESLKVPVSLIAAGRGMCGPEHIAEWRSRLPRSPVVTVAGPHNLHEAAPLDLANAVRDLRH